MQQYLLAKNSNIHAYDVMNGRKQLPSRLIHFALCLPTHTSKQRNPTNSSLTYEKLNQFSSSEDSYD